MTEWHLVVSFARPYGGVEVDRSDGLKISVPFLGKAAAERALGEMSVTVERGEPEVIQGQVVAEVPAITAASERSR